MVRKLLVFLLFVVPAFAADTLHVNFDTLLVATADGSINFAASTFNYGIRDSMTCGKTGTGNDSAMVFLYFPLSYMRDSTVVITAAICSLHTNATGAAYPATVSLYRMSSDWLEGTKRGAVDSAGACVDWRGFGTSVTGRAITSANKAWTLPMRSGAGFDATAVAAANTYYTWEDIVVLIQSLLDSPPTNYGIIAGVATAVNSKYAYFNSREDATYKPYLHITGYFVVPKYPTNT